MQFTITILDISMRNLHSATPHLFISPSFRPHMRSLVDLAHILLSLEVCHLLSCGKLIATIRYPSVPSLLTSCIAHFRLLPYLVYTSEKSGPSFELPFQGRIKNRGRKNKIKSRLILFFFSCAFILNASRINTLQTAQRKRERENTFRAKSTLHNTLPLFLCPSRLLSSYYRVSCFASSLLLFSNESFLF